MSMWMRNTAGKDDAMFTFSFIAFVVVVAKFLLANVSITVATHSYNFGSVDAASIAALLTPTLGAYVARRHSETKYGGNDPDPDDGNARESDPAAKKEE